MKLVASVIAFALALTASSPEALARSCATNKHRACARPAHFAHQRWPIRIIAAVPPEAPLVPYASFYPPMPATLFDLPPDRDFLNTLR